MHLRAFIILFASVFIGTMGISMVSPLLPVYAEDLGATGIWIGLTFSVFAITQTIFGPIVGRISDRFGRKIFIVGGLLIYFVAAIGYLTAESFVQVFIFRAISGIGTACIFSIARAYVGDMVPRGQEGRWFGLFQTADIVGFGIGPLLAGGVRQFFGFDAVFISMAALMLAAAGFASVLLPGQASAKREEWDIPTPDASFLSALKDRLVLGVTLNMGLAAITFGATFSFLAVLMEDRLEASPALIGVAFSMVALSAGLGQPIFGRVADRVNRKVLVTIGLGVAAVALFGIGTVPPIWILLGLLVMMGIGEAIIMVTTSAMQVVAGRRAGMGTVIGLGTAGQGIGIVFGSIAGGSAVDSIGLEAAFYFGAITMIIGAPIFLLLTRGEPVNERELSSEEMRDGALRPGEQPAGGR